MLERGLYIIIMLLCATTFFWVHALSSGQKKVIIENFRKQQYELLFESDVELFDADETSILDISRKLDIYDSIASKVSESREQAEEKKDNLWNIIYSLETTLASLDKQIVLATAKIKRINGEIVTTKQEIKTTSQEMVELRKKIAKSNQVLLDYLVYIYKKSNTLYTQDDVDNLKSILLNNEDISSVIDDLYYKSLIQVAGANIVQEHRNLVKDLYTQKIHLEQSEKSLKALRKTEIVEKSVLKDKQAFKQRLLDASKSQQKQYETFIAQKIELERSINIKSVQQKIKFRNLQKKLLDKHDCQFVDISKDSLEIKNISEKCLNLNKIIASESKLTDIKKLEWTLFSWPVIPTKSISAYFRDGWYRQEFGADHNAIDIPVDQSTPIRAPMSGYVIHVEPPLDDGYSFVAIKHPEWFVSVYGHLSQVAVEQYDFVKKWQVFAMSGGEYGTPWAGYLTTGPHLHFELFRDKKYVDPLNFLDISILPFADIDDKYRYKYYADFKARKWYEYVESEDDKRLRFNIKWDSEIERQKYLLNTYARSDFRNWEMWVSESLDANIDPTFVMCIGLAESGLWTNLTTDYNVWNVWNTDSGDRVKYPNPKSGIYAIVRTLNNKFLWSYDSIDKLSCYGNTQARLCDRSQPIGHFVYASSSDHWHNNIIKCMSHVKGLYVPDDYEFRLR